MEIMCQQEHRLDVRDVVFSYGNSGKPVFNGLNLIIPPRGKVAIVGANGSGKSTLIKLLLRLYDVKHGSIKLDGVDICSYRVLTALFSPAFSKILRLMLYLLVRISLWMRPGMKTR